MRVSAHGKKYLGRLEFLSPLQDLSQSERVRLADLLASYALDILKGSVTGRPLVDLYVERD